MTKVLVPIDGSEPARHGRAGRPNARSAAAKVVHLSTVPITLVK
jgi:hypothetical protein